MSNSVKIRSLELKDVDLGKREAVIAHAGYDNIDDTQDISRKGMFNKSWQEKNGGADVLFYFNHDDGQAPGFSIKAFEDNEHAYTHVKFGTHTLGNDTLIMINEGTIKKASFGYRTIKSNRISVKGQNVRELKEVSHIETSILTKVPANQKTFVEGVKSLYGNDIAELKESLILLEKFCRNTKASDDCIKSMMQELDNIKAVIAKYDTMDTSLATKPPISVEEEKQFDNEIINSLTLLNLKLKLN